MPEQSLPPFVRVRVKSTGAHISTRYPNPKLHVELKQAATDANGRALPPKPRDEPAAGTSEPATAATD